MDIRSILVILFLVFLFSAQNFMFSLGMTCKDNEREALLSIKQDLKDHYNSLSSWSRENENCCRWAGVECDNVTDHVVLLLIQGPWLEGKLNPSLQELKQLRHLDLSMNNFEGSIPDFLGSLQNLRYLDLCRAGFSGMIPHQLGNLSNLRYLDIGFNDGLNIINGNYEWLSHLSSLQYLNLSNVNLQNASNCLQAISMLPSLLTLDLSYCALDGLPSFLYGNVTSLAVLDLSHNWLISILPESLYKLTNLEWLDLSSNSFQCTVSASIGNLTKLTVLDLSNGLGRLQNLNSILPESLYRLTNLEWLGLDDNYFQGTISASIGNLTKLTVLDLSYNQLSGPLPDQLGRLQNLDYLSLKFNSFSGSIPFSIGRLTLLRELDLRFNKLNGSVPESFRNLSKLETLLLSHNALEGIVSDTLFSNLTSLEEIELDSVVLKVSPEWIPPFQLQTAQFINCGLGPRFPNWIQTQKNLTYLDLSNNGFSGAVPTWFWNLSSQFYYFNLSHNHFNGELPKVLKGNDSFWTNIYLNSNKFEGPLPRLGLNILSLDLSDNLISGPISALLCNPFTKANELEILDLSNNLLSGNLSQCWDYWTSLKILLLGNNKITGKISSSTSSLYRLLSLHLQKNNLSDELPLALRNCTFLKILDIGENMLTGRLPIWLGESLPDLIVLRLRLNKFHGEMPQELCGMTSLQILDLAHNNLSGSIPRCFNNFTAMATKQNSIWPIDYLSIGDNGETAISLVTKGRELEYYSKILIHVTNMDLSKNYLSGEIPEELTSLIGLLSLNLSDNRFIGKIPEKIGNMSSLESLDFSKNRISGVIPQSISSLTFLSYLNLSYNSLSGKIPSSTQLQSFNMSSYIGNEELCGLPLIKYCNGEEPLQKPGDIVDRDLEDEDWFEMKWFYMSMGVGFAVGFWAFWGVMVLKSSWRIAYFLFLDGMKEKLCLLF